MLFKCGSRIYYSRGEERRSAQMRILLGIIIGGGLGFLVGYFGRCASGACPLTGNPYVSTVVGAILGALIAGRF
jgi:hypothetical protein